MKKIVCIILATLFLIVPVLNNVYAVQMAMPDGGGQNPSYASGVGSKKGFFEAIFGEGKNFEGQGEDKGANSPGNTLKRSLTSLIEEMKKAFFSIGNLIFIICAIVLGIKYIMQSSQGKADIKSGLANLLTGAVFFYSADIVNSFATGAFKEVFAESTLDSMMGRVFATFIPIAQMLAFGGIIFLGLKYMYADPKEKSRIKSQIVPLIVGCILVFSTTRLLSFAVNAATSTLAN